MTLRFCRSSFRSSTGDVVSKEGSIALRCHSLALELQVCPNHMMQTCNACAMRMHSRFDAQRTPSSWHDGTEDGERGGREREAWQDQHTAGSG